MLMSVYFKDNPNFFKLAIESVSINQTLQPNQVVVVQDGPLPEIFDDIIRDLAERVHNIEFTTVKLERNSGLAVALNTGIDACKYEWIARMDSDDISVATRFEKQVKFLEINSNIDVLGGAIAEFKEKIGDIQSERHTMISQADIIKRAKTRNPMNHVTVIYKKSALIDVGKYTENIGSLEDYKLWVDMIFAHKILHNIDEVLVNVRIGNGFITRRSNKKRIRNWDILQKYLLKNHFINKFTALKNKFSLRIFIYMPKWVKKLTYKVFLRK